MVSMKDVLRKLILVAGTASVVNCGDVSNLQDNNSLTAGSPSKADAPSALPITVTSSRTEINQGDNAIIHIDATSLTPIFMAESPAIKRVLKKEGDQWVEAKGVKLATASLNDKIVKIISEEACSEFYVPDDDTGTVGCTSETKKQSPDCCVGNSSFGVAEEISNIPIGTYKVEVEYKLGCGNARKFSTCKTEALLATSNEFSIVESDINKDICESAYNVMAECRKSKTVEECVGQNGTDLFNKNSQCCTYLKKYEYSYNWKACQLLDNKVPTLDQYAKLSGYKKMDLLYPYYNGNYEAYEPYELDMFFDQNKIQAGELRGAAQDDYNKHLKSILNVNKISFNNIAYAYTVEIGGESWYEIKVYDNNFKFIGKFGYAYEN